MSPLEAADALVATREIITNTASKHGLRATLSPRVYADARKHNFIYSTSCLISTKKMIFILASLINLTYAEPSAGSAAHAHISVQPTGAIAQALANETCQVSPNMNALEGAFLDSLLKHLPAIQALSLPLPASYLRVVDGIWSGGTYVCWGTENKEAPVRLVDPHTPKSRRFEIKSIDGLSNPSVHFPLLCLARIAGSYLITLIF